MIEILSFLETQTEYHTPNEIKKGVVKDEKLRQKAIDKIKNFALNLGLEIIKEQDSGIKGPKGNLEHFILLRKY